MVQAILVLATMAGIMWFMVKDVVSFKSAGQVRDKEFSLGTVGSFFLGLAGVASIAGLIERGALSVSSLFTVAIGIGILTGLMARYGELRQLGAWGLSIIGLAAAAPAISSLVSGTTACGTSTPVIGVIASGALLAVVYVLAAVVTGVATKKIQPGFGLALFGGVEVLAFMNSPLGVDLVGNAPLAYIVSIVGAIVLGYAVIGLPEVLLALFSVTILLAIFGTEQFGAYCGPGIDYMSAQSTFIGFAVGFVVMLMITRVFGGRSR